MGKSESSTGERPEITEEGNPVATSIVIPVYNESGNVIPLTGELTKVLDSEAAGPYGPYEIVFVDDGSTDGTQEQLTELVSEHGRVAAVILRRNFGQSSALAAGIDHATGTRIVTMDGDRQNDPADIPRLLDSLDSGYDCVKGWRKDRQDTWRKTIPSALQTRLTWLIGPRLHDYVCGIAAYRTAAIRDVAIVGGTHRYLPAILHERGYRVSELEVNHRSRPVGQSKYGPGRLVRGFVDLLFFAYWSRFAKRPVHGLAGAAVAVLALTALLVLVTVIGTTLGLLSPLPALVGATAITGTGIVTATVLFVGSLLAGTATRRYYRSARPYRVESVLSEHRSSTPGVDRHTRSKHLDSDFPGGEEPGAISSAGETGRATSPSRDQIEDRDSD